MTKTPSKTRSRGPAIPPGRRPWLPRAQRLDEVTGVLAAALPGLDAGEATALVERVASGLSLAWLQWHLGERPDTLGSGRSDVPIVVLRLLHALHQAGQPVVLPGCARCGRTAKSLPGTVDGGRICKPCVVSDRIEACTRCDRLTRVYARPSSGPVCQRCWVNDPAQWQPCSRCGQPGRVATRAEDGSAICPRCYRTPSEPCVRCGEVRAVAHRSADGPLCPRCHRSPAQRCDRCGQLHPLVTRRSADREALCRGCYRARWVGVCVACGRQRPCTPSRALGGELLCASCWPRKTARCVRCDRDRRVLTTWPIGPVCGSCYAWVRAHPADCAHCGDERVLVARDDHGVGLCPACAGVALDYECRRCGRSGHLLADHLCPGCLAAERARTLLAGPDGTVRSELEPLLEALLHADSPGAVLQWLDPAKPASALLTKLAASTQPLSHELLDTLPPTLALHRLRQTLVHTGTLPERNDYLERLVPWLDNLLAERPAAHAQVIRPYTHWTLLRRARQQARRRPHTTGSGNWARSRVLAALRLLAWLDQHKLTLAELDQDQLDHWLTSHPPSSVYPAREFLAWTCRHGLTGPVTIPKHQPATTLDPISEDERWAQLKRCLHDHALPLEVRAAGALVLLYGLSVRRISDLQAEQLHSDGDRTYLRLAQHKLLLPPALATLLHRQKEQATSVSVIHRSHPAGPAWLFPGGFPGRPASDAIYRKLRQHGIPHARRARSAALITLAAELPPPILADLLDLNITTAVQWAQHTQQDNAAYIEARIATGGTQT